MRDQQQSSKSVKKFTDRPKITTPISVDWLLRQIAQIPGPKKQRKGWINVICPFHNDHSPSLGICVIPGSSKLGSISCWSCSAKGDWDKLASRLGLQMLSTADVEAYPMMPPIVQELEDRSRRQESYALTLSKGFGHEDSNRESSRGLNYGASIHDLLTEELLWNDHKLELVIDWPQNSKWRTIDGTLLYELGAKSGLRYGEKYIWLPVNLEQELVGSWIGRLSKSKDPKVSSYLNSSGTWISTVGLWPYDYVQQMPKRLPIVLVEGQRDALRLIAYGIPTLCMFGTNSISPEKLAHVMALGRQIYQMGDGDNAGREFNSHLKQMFRQHGELTKTISLPDDVDPAKLTSIQLKDLKSMLLRRCKSIKR